MGVQTCREHSLLLFDISHAYAAKSSSCRIFAADRGLLFHCDVESIKQRLLHRYTSKLYSLNLVPTLFKCHHGYVEHRWLQSRGLWMYRTCCKATFGGACANGSSGDEMMDHNEWGQWATMRRWVSNNQIRRIADDYIQGQMMRRIRQQHDYGQWRQGWQMMDNNEDEKWEQWTTMRRWVTICLGPIIFNTPCVLNYSACCLAISRAQECSQVACHIL